MMDRHLEELSDEEYRSRWLAFHESIDWSTRVDVTHDPITSFGPKALYRKNKGSFMNGLRREIHCRPYVAHMRRSRDTGVWMTEQEVYDMSQVPALDLSDSYRRPFVDIGSVLAHVRFPRLPRAHERVA